MPSKLGRNDPCWCGSGKKYKFCHMRQDLEEAAKETSPPALAARAERELPAPRLSPEEEEANARWERFQVADVEDKAAIFTETLAAGKLDGEEAYEMLEAFREEADARHNPQARAPYAELVERLRCEAPELHYQDLAYYHVNLIDDAIADGRWTTVAELVTAFSQVLPDGIELFSQVIDQMMYHGQGQALINTMSQVWCKVSESEELLAWAIDEFAGQLILLVLFNYLETADVPQADDPMLHEAVAPYGKFDADWLKRAVRHLTVPTSSAWQPSDFDESVDADRWTDNLNALLFEFMADQRRRAGLPLSRSELVRTQLLELLHRQLAEPPETGGRRRASRRRSGRKRGRRKAAPIPAPSSSLVPRHAVLDQFLVGLFHFLGAQPYKGGALMELLPPYLHFLACLELIHPVAMDDALTALQPLGDAMLQVLDDYGADLRLIQTVEDAWSEAKLSALRDDPSLAQARAKPPAVPTPPLAPARRPGALQTYTFKVIYLRDPAIWRTIEIAENQTLDDLHHAIQRAVRFDEDHLYSFYMSGRAWDDRTEYASPHAQGRSAARIRIGDLRLRMKQRFLYLFDYGDEHRFEVQLVATNPDAPKGEYPNLVERHGRNPPQYAGWEDEEWEEE